MSEPPAGADDSLTPELWHQVDRACDRFEAAWRAAGTAGRPRLEDYLAEAPAALRPVLLPELLALELAYRRRAGERPEPAEYTARFPDQPALVAAAFAEAAPPNTPDLAAPTTSRAAGPLHPPGTASFSAGGQGATPAGGASGPIAGVLGDFELLEQIGTGGMGVVYRARQRSVNRLVAVKVLSSAHLDDTPERARQWTERFRAEAQAVARLEHEHVVPVIEAGEDGGRLYYAMRLVEGRSLADLIRTGPLPGRQAAAYLEPVARAIHHAHGRGIVHRDLKPGNILLDGGDRPLVADFGLAKWLEGGQRLTQTGHCLGSPPYMSPEQVQDSARVTPVSDVYSLGATLYDLVTGRPPFQAATVMETFGLVCHEEPVPPRQLNPGIDRDLQTIVLHCLHKEPPRRYRSAEELADDLGRYLRGEPIRARPVGPAGRLWRWCRRNPVLAGLTAAVVLLTVATLVAVSIGYATTARASAEARANLRQALFREAEALRRSTQPGRRWQALRALEGAARLAPGPDLRDEYLRCLEVAGLRPVDEPESEPLPKVLGGTEPIVVSPDGRFLVAGTADRQEWQVWELAGRRKTEPPRGTLRDDRGRAIVPHCLAFSDRAEWLAVASLDQERPRRYSITLFDLTAGPPRPVQSWKWEAEALDCLCFRPDAKVLAAGTTIPTGQGTYGIQLWHVPDGRSAEQLPLERLGSFSRSQVVSRRLAFSPDGRFLAAARRNLRLWDLAPAPGPPGPALLFTRPLEAEADAVYLVADARQVLSVHADGQLRLWDAVQSGQLLAQAPRDAPLSAEPADPPRLPRSTRLFLHRSGDQARGIRGWEVGQPLTRSFAPRRPTPGPLTPATGLALAFSPDERWLAFGLNDPASPYLVDLHKPDAEPVPLAGGAGAWALAFSAPGDWLWGASSAGQTVWQLPGLRRQAEPPERWLAAAVNARGERIGARLEETAQVKVLDVASGQETSLMGDEVAVADLPSPLHFSPDGKQLLAVLESAPRQNILIRAWELPGGRVLYERKGSTGHVFFRGPHARELVHPEWLQVRDLEQDRHIPSDRPDAPMPPPYGNYGFPSRFTFSADGRLAAETGMWGEIAFWEFADPKRILRAQVHRTSRKPGLTDGRDPKAFSRDGSRLAALDGADRLRVWDTHNGKELGALELKRRPELFAFDDAGRELLLVYLGHGLEAWRPGEAGTRQVCPLEADARLREESTHFWLPEELRIQDALRLTGDRKRLVYASQVDGEGFSTVYVWQLPDGRLTTRRVRLSPGAWPRLAVNADGSQVALLGTSARLRVCNLATGAACLTLQRTALAEGNREGPMARLQQAVRLSPDGDYAALLDDLRHPPAVRVFDLVKGEFFTEALPQLGSSLALARDARLLAVAQERQVLVLDPHSRRGPVTLPPQPAPVTDLALDERTGLLAVASAEDGAVRLWRVPAGELLATLSTDHDGLQRVALSPSGRWLATLDRRGRLRLLDLAEARDCLRAVGLDW
jgi:WD40 repeat protein